MKTTLILDDDLVQAAQELTGIQDKAALIQMALKTLVVRAASQRLADLGGTMPEMKDIPRYRAEG